MWDADVRAGDRIIKHQSVTSDNVCSLAGGKVTFLLVYLSSFQWAT
jgi:hypothetical protein